MSKGVRAYLQEGMPPAVLDEYDPETGMPIERLPDAALPRGFDNASLANPPAPYYVPPTGDPNSGVDPQLISQGQADPAAFSGTEGYLQESDAGSPDLAVGQWGGPGADPRSAPWDATPPKAMEQPASAGPPAPPGTTSLGPHTDVSPVTGALNALDKYAAAIKGTPQMGKPKWWQQGLSAGFGFGAGWTNAAGRIRNPIDINAASQGILHPLYQQRLAQYEHNVIAPARAAAELEGQKFAVQQTAAKDAATIAHLKGQTDYLEGLGRTSTMVTPEMETATHGLFKAGSYVPANILVQELKNQREVRQPRAAVTTEEKYAEAQRIYPASAGGTPEKWRQMAYNPTSVEKKEKETQPKNLNIVDVLLDPDAPPEQKKLARSLFDQEHKGTGAADAALNEFRQLRNEQLRQQMDDKQRDATNKLLEQKVKDGNQIDQQRIASLQSVQINTNLNAADREKDKQRQINDINEKARNAHQAVQDRYAAEWRSHGLQADDWDWKITPDGHLTTEKRGQQQPRPTSPWRIGYGPSGPAATPAAPTPAKPSPVGTAPVKPVVAAPVKPAALPAPAPAPAEQPIRIELPNGKTKLFPNRQSLEKFAAEAGLTLSQHKQ